MIKSELVSGSSTGSLYLKPPHQEEEKKHLLVQYREIIMLLRAYAYNVYKERKFTKIKILNKGQRVHSSSLIYLIAGQAIPAETFSQCAPSLLVTKKSGIWCPTYMYIVCIIL